MRATRPHHQHERTEATRPQGESAPERAADDGGAPGSARAALGSFAVSATAPAVQLKALARAIGRVHDAAEVHAVAARGVGGRGASLPHAERIQRAFGRHDVSGVRAHVGGAAAEASAALGAAAYARGEDLAFARGPDLFVAAHEAAHVVQQRAGVSLSGGVGSAGDAHERHADEVAHAVVAGRSAEPLLDRYRGSGGGARIQRKEAAGAEGTTAPSADAAPNADAATATGGAGNATGADAATTTGGAGNAGATPGAVTAPKFVDSQLEMMWLVAGARQGPGLEKAFRMLDGRAPKGPWAHVSWDLVKARAIALLFKPDGLQQGELPVCGPAVIVNTMIGAQPARFVALARTVFETGTWMGRALSSELLQQKPQGTPQQLDWMLLSAMRDGENATLDFQGTTSEGVAGMTPPKEIEAWMKTYLHCTDVRRFTSHMWGEADNVARVNALMGDPHQVVYLLVDSDRLQSSGAGANVPNHWIRLTAPITRDGDKIIIKAFCWGQVTTFELAGGEALEDTLFEIVTGKIPG